MEKENRRFARIADSLTSAEVLEHELQKCRLIFGIYPIVTQAALRVRRSLHIMIFT